MPQTLASKIIPFVKNNYLIIILTIIGTALRLYNFKSTLIFLGDQGRDAYVVRELLVEKDPILIGPTTSVGKIQLGPLYYYFMAPWLFLFNYDPVGPAYGVVLLGIITIPVFYLILKKIFSQKLALISVALYTFADVIIANTRSSWNPNPMPLIIMLLIYSAYKIYCERNYKHILWIFVWYSIALQLHYMALLLAPMLAIIALLTFLQNKKDIKRILIYGSLGLLIFFLFTLPLVIFDLRHDFINYQGLVEFFVKGHHSSKSLIDSIKSIEGRMYQITGHILGLETLWKVRDISSYLLVLSFIYIFIKNKKNKSYHIILAYLVSTLLGLALYSGDVYEHYIGFAFPLSFILIGIVLEKIYSLHPAGKIAVSFLVALLISVNLSYYRFKKPLGWQLKDIKQVSQVISQDVGNTPYNIVLVDSTRDYRAMNYRYFLKHFNTNVKSIDQYSGIDTMYLISNDEQIEGKELLIWEVQSFLEGNCYLEPEKEFESLKPLITKTWHFPGGPWVYKLEKPQSQ
jgi:4-amino-4-deoxy-L-arabinose transferase-like glycosyltransferase